MIDPNKTYQTKSGREWRYYGENGNGQIHGAFKDILGLWCVNVWNENGEYSHHYDSSMDLVEVKHRIKRTYWFNVYENSGYDICTLGTREFADSRAYPNRLACVKVEIDCEIGEGL
jgi:hypothetical protein